MRRVFAVAGAAVVIAALGVMAVAGVAAAQTPPAGQGTTTFNLAEQMREALAKALNITPEQLTTAIGTARDQVLNSAVAQGKLTQEQADKIKERAQDNPNWGFGIGPLRGKIQRGMAFKGGFSLGIVSDKLGMTPQELHTQLQAGKTIADLAKEKNVDPQSIADALIQPQADQLAKAVANGKLTQAQADEMLARHKDAVQKMLTQQWTGLKDGLLGKAMPRLPKLKEGLPQAPGAFGVLVPGGSV